MPPSVVWYSLRTAYQLANMHRSTPTHQDIPAHSSQELGVTACITCYGHEQVMSFYLLVNMYCSSKSKSSKSSCAEGSVSCKINNPAGSKAELPVSLLEPQIVHQILSALSKDLSVRNTQDILLPGGFIGSYLQTRQETHPSLYNCPVPPPGTGFL